MAEQELRSFMEELDNTRPSGIGEFISFRSILGDEVCMKNWGSFERELQAEREKVAGIFETSLEEINRRIEAVPKTTNQSRESMHESESEVSRRERDSVERELSKVYQKSVQLQMYVNHNFSMSKTLVRYWDVVNSQGDGHKLGDEQYRLVREFKDHHYKIDTKKLHTAEIKLKEESMKRGVDAIGRAQRFQRRSRQETGLSAFYLGVQSVLLFEIAILMFKSPIIPHGAVASLPVFRCSFMMALLLWCAVLVIRVFEIYEINYAWILHVPTKVEINARGLSVLAHVQLLLFSLPFLCFLLDVKFDFFSNGFLMHDSYALISAFFTTCLWLLPFLNILPWMSGARVAMRSCMLSVLFCFLPVYQVTFASNLLGDVLTSFVKPLKDVIYTWCYLAVVIRARADPMDVSDIRIQCAPVQGTTATMVILQVPFILRLIQCLKRSYAASCKSEVCKSEVRNHLVNAGKYSASLLCSIVAFVDWEARGLSASKKLILIIFGYIVATLYSLYWDIRKDWSIDFNFERVQDKAKASRQVTESQLYPKMCYIVATLIDALCRTTWATTMMPSSVFYNDMEPVQEQTFVTIISVIELLRRSMWTLIRLENEQVTNASGYRPKELAWVPPKEVKADDTYQRADVSRDKVSRTFRRAQTAFVFPWLRETSPSVDTVGRQLAQPLVHCKGALPA